ncbi:MAG: ACP S-malonyltransferase [Christensenellaceae bacterium]|jgi:[acyl-carrier-protein] S-malonyltransferase|nr:ACP S-malonyltransferase [Christensenellaceae bacterium]
MNVVLLLEGQGSYSTEKTKQLIQHDSNASALWKNADKILGWSISDLVHKNEHTGMLETDLAQPMIFLMEYTAWHCAKNTLPEAPNCVVGHSLGEITALAAAEVLCFEDALLLTARRGEVMQKFTSKEPQGMAALIGASSAEAEQLCKQVSQELDLVLTCANYNSPSQIVISGYRKALERAAELTTSVLKPLQVTRAFHTPLMKFAADVMDEAMSKLKFYPSKIPVISGVTARPYPASWTVRHLLKKQITSPVRWTEIMNYLQEKGFTTFLQTSERTLFRDMNPELRDVVCWGSLEQWSNGELYNFDNLFRKGSSVLFAVGVLSDCLRKMIANPWPENIASEDVKQAQGCYHTVLDIWKKQASEPTQREVGLALKNLSKVLTIKKIDSKTKSEQIENILEKYGIKGMY